MKLTAMRSQQGSDQSALHVGTFTPVLIDFQAPGGTIGRSPENKLILPDDKGALCRVQAVVRISGDDCYLVNLSDMAQVSINGCVLGRDQEAPLHDGDEIAIGSYTLNAGEASARSFSSVDRALRAAMAALLATDDEPLDSDRSVKKKPPE